MSAEATGSASTATGSYAKALNDFSTATGELAIAAGALSTATGSNSQAVGANATATGVLASAAGDNSTATGEASQATGDSSTALGASAYASGARSTASGFSTLATGANASAFGAGAVASGANSLALGDRAGATFNNSVAIGQNVKTTRADQVSIGSATNTYTLAGVASAQSRAAQTGPTSFVTSDQAGNLAVSNYGPADIASLDSRVGALESSVLGGMDKAYEGTAMALAMAGAGLPGDANYAVSINWGTFQGQNAFAGTAAIRLSDHFQLNGGIGVGAGQGTVGGRAGLMLTW